jgi:hypothetical protein
MRPFINIDQRNVDPSAQGVIARQDLSRNSEVPIYPKAGIQIPQMRAVVVTVSGWAEYLRTLRQGHSNPRFNRIGVPEIGEVKAYVGQLAVALL